MQVTELHKRLILPEGMRSFITSCYKFASQYLSVIRDAGHDGPSEGYRSTTPTRYLPSVGHLFDDDGYFEEPDDDSSSEGEHTFPESPDEYSAFQLEMDIELDYYCRSPGTPGMLSLTYQRLSCDLTS